MNDSNATTVEKTFLDVMQLATGPTTSDKESGLNDFIYVLMARIIKNGNVNSRMETRLSTLSDQNIFMDSVICHIKTQQSFVTQVTHFVRRAGDDHVKALSPHDGKIRIRP